MQPVTYIRIRNLSRSFVKGYLNLPNSLTKPRLQFGFLRWSRGSLESLMPRCWMCLSTESTGAKKHSLMDLKESGTQSFLSMSTLHLHRDKMPCGSVLTFMSKVATAVLCYQPYLYGIVNSMRNTSSSLQFEWT